MERNSLSKKKALLALGMMVVGTNSSRVANWQQPNCNQYACDGQCIKCSFRFWMDCDARCHKVSDQCKTWCDTTGECTSCYCGFDLVNGCCVNSQSVGSGSGENCQKPVCYQDKRVNNIWRDPIVCSPVKNYPQNKPVYITPPKYCPEPPKYCPEPPKYCPEPPKYCPEPPKYCPEPPKYCPEPPKYCPEPPKYCPEPPQICIQIGSPRSCRSGKSKNSCKSNRSPSPKSCKSHKSKKSCKSNKSRPKSPPCGLPPALPNLRFNGPPGQYLVTNILNVGGKKGKKGGKK